MICKVCSNRLDKKERFCPYCGSYFIDAEAEDDSLKWNGIIREDGTVLSDVKLEADMSAASSMGRSPAEPKDSPKVWGILAVIFAGIALACSIAEKFVDVGMFIVGIPCFVFGCVACKKAAKGKIKAIAMFLLFLAVIIFMIIVLSW